MPFLLSAFWPSSPAEMRETTMPSADFCALTPHVSMQSAIGVRREMLSGSCFPVTGLVSAVSTRVRLDLVCRVDPSRILS
jgi:hypothetical protein